MLRIVRLLLDRGADIETRNGPRHTPLHEAARRGKVETKCYFRTQP